MQSLLYIFCTICILASTFYFWRHKAARNIWLLGIIFAAGIAVCTPWLMDRLGNALLTVCLAAGAGVAAFLFVAVLAARDEPARQEDESEEPAPQGVNIRYLYGSVRSSELPLSMNASVPAGSAINNDVDDVQHTSDGTLTLWRRFALWRENRRALRYVRREEGRTSLQEEIAARTGRPFSQDEEALLHLYDDTEDEAEAEGKSFFAYSDPDEEEKNAFEAPLGIETGPRIPPAEPAAQSIDSDRNFTEDGPHWGEEIAASRESRRERPRTAPMETPALVETPAPMEILSPVLIKQPAPTITETPIITETSKPPVSPADAQKITPAEQSLDIPAGIVLQPLVREPVTSRMGNEVLMDQAFALMNDGKWSEAADMFLRFRDSAEAEWLRKQADVERLSALLHAKRYTDAIDVMFFILDSGYDLSIQERAQITNVLRRLQGG